MNVPTRFLWSFLIAAVVIGTTIWAVLYLKPPTNLTMAAGPRDGAYFRIALQYRALLGRDGLNVTIVETQGSAENAALLADGAVDVALIQGGIAVPGDRVQSLGKMFDEPLWLLYETRAPVPSNPVRWEGLRINSGAEGSGTRVAFSQFEAAVTLSPAANVQTGLGYSEALLALQANEIDLAVFVAPIDAPYLREAYSTGQFSVLQPNFVDAISRRMADASLVDIPPGAVSFDPPIPPSPRRLLTLQARLVAQEDLHPAFVNRLVMAAIEIHGKRGLLQEEGTFPAVNSSDLPINNSARSLVLNGPSAVHDWLPYWMAAQLNRFLLLLLPLFFIVLPLMRALPAIYAYLQKYRVWQAYPTFREIEQVLESGADMEALNEIVARLSDLDARLAQMKLPAPFRQTAYEARLHIDLLQRRIITERDRLTETVSHTPSMGDRQN
ncbi:MAG: TAXI family TRAP transporter solute-binding subunit [Pseudomonadota bacterium]